MIEVNEIMSSNPYTLRTNQTIGDAIRLMADKHIRHIPIVNDEDELAGIVTHRDLLAATGTKLDNEAELKSELANYPLGDIMTTHVKTVDPKADLISTARYLETHKIGALPVVKQNKVVGIVTDYDFLAVSINLLEQMINMGMDEEPYD